MSSNFTIVFDAGHGGTNLAEGSTPNNAVGANGLLEKDLTLKIAKIAAAKLNSKNFRAFLTRDDDRNLSLAERARKSRETGADAFVSLHFNGHRDAAVDGTEVYISNASDEKDAALANELVKTVSLAASAPLRGVRKTDFTILKGDFHVSKTAACLVEMAYLTNPQQANKLLSPNYVEHLASAIAQSVANYANQISYSQSFAEETGEKTIAEVWKEHADPKNFPIDLPEPGKGTDTIRISIPQNLKFSRWEVEILADSPGAGYKVVEAPKAGAEGNHTITVDWWHLPYGKINFKLKAYASPDGASVAEKVVFNSKGWMEKAKDQIAQGIPVQLAVKGEKAKLIYEAFQKHQANQKGKQAGTGGVAIAMEPITITVVILVGIVIFGILVALGLFTLGAVIKMALDKGYNVKDTKYKAGVGEGQLRQDHEIAFNLTQPEKAVQTQSFQFGLDDSDAGDFQTLDYSSDALQLDCGNSTAIEAKEVYKVFKPMLPQTKIGHGEKYDFNVFLRWNRIPKNVCEIDVVVHFHGYNNPDGATIYRVAELSGLDLSDPTGQTSVKRAAPTLCIMPLGKNEPSSKRKDRHVFPFFNSENGLQDLINDSLNFLAENNGLSKGILKMRRLILTAHSGGGTAIRDVLGRKVAGTLKLAGDINEVHLFDATYDGALQVKKWLNDRKTKDSGLTESEMPTKGGALRVLYLPCGSQQRKYNAENGSCNTSETETEARRIEEELNKLIPASSHLRRWYRVEQTNVKHNDIPKTFGFQLLADGSANIAPAPVKAAAKPACCPTFPNCVCRGEPAKTQSLSFEYEEPDYFAVSESYEPLL